jgi:hypothetical protein
MVMDTLAGIICGLVMGTVFLGAGIYFVMVNRDIYERLNGRLPEGVSPTIVMLGFVVGTPPLWAFMGAIAGLIYHQFEDAYPDSGLGSSNFAFTVTILVIAAFAILIAIAARRRAARLGLVVSIAFAGIFGWLLPLIANWR